MTRPFNVPLCRERRPPMMIGRIRASILVAGMLVAFFGASSAQAQLTGDRLKCLTSTAKTSQKFVAAKLKLLQKCRNADLKDGGCPTPDAAKIAKIEGKLAAGIAKACPLTTTDFA